MYSPLNVNRLIGTQAINIHNFYILIITIISIITIKYFLKILNHWLTSQSRVLLRGIQHVFKPSGRKSSGSLYFALF